MELPIQKPCRCSYYEMIIAENGSKRNKVKMKWHPSLVVVGTIVRCAHLY
jgi:hypothetical protein